MEWFSQRALYLRDEFDLIEAPDFGLKSTPRDTLRKRGEV